MSYFPSHIIKNSFLFSQKVLYTFFVSVSHQPSLLHDPSSSLPSSSYTHSTASPPFLVCISCINIFVSLINSFISSFHHSLPFHHLSLMPYTCFTLLRIAYLNAFHSYSTSFLYPICHLFSLFSNLKSTTIIPIFHQIIHIQASSC